MRKKLGEMLIILIIVLGICTACGSTEETLFHGAEYGMKLSEVRASVDLGNPYEVFDESLWYNSYDAIVVDNASIAAEIHFDFTEDGYLYNIRYEFEESTEPDLELVAQYLNELYGEENAILVNDGALTGTIEQDDYNIVAKGKNIRLESKIYTEG